MKRKLLRIASYVSIATVGWIGGLLFSGEISLWGTLILCAMAGTLLTAVSVLLGLEARRDVRIIDTLEMRCKVLERWSQMLVDQHAIHEHLLKGFDGQENKAIH